jgi:AcrR family transcriptional regulator
MAKIVKWTAEAYCDGLLIKKAPVRRTVQSHRYERGNQTYCSERYITGRSLSKALIWRSMGRPREFDIEKAVDTAVDLFWRNGYDQTSLTDLTKAMKINSPSFYFAFGSKEKLFRMALDHYMTRYSSFVYDALAQPTARDIAVRIFQGCAEAYTDRAHPPGCLGVNCGLPCPDDADPVRLEIARQREVLRLKLRKRLKKAVSSGDLPSDSDADDLSHFVLVVMWGMAVAAQSGASRADLLRTGARAMKAWPRSA